MNMYEQINLLSLRLEDASKVKFTTLLLIRALANAKLKLAQMLHDNYLTELEYLDDNSGTGHTATNGKLAITSLTYGVLRGAQGILKVKIHDGLYCTRIDLDDLKRTENTFLTGSAVNPLYYVFQNTIYVNAGVTSPIIDVYHLKAPIIVLYEFNADQADSGASVSKFDGRAADSLSVVDSYYNGAVIYSLQYSKYFIIIGYVGADLEFEVSPSSTGNFTENQKFYFLTHSFDELNLSGVTSELNESLHELEVTLAEAECWALDEKLDRRNAALNQALGEIKVLNDRYVKATGIGTDKERR